MKTYSTTLYIKVQAENEDEAIRKMYDLLCSGEVQINSLMEEENGK